MCRGGDAVWEQLSSQGQRPQIKPSSFLHIIGLAQTDLHSPPSHAKLPLFPAHTWVLIPGPFPLCPASPHLD